MMSRSLIAVSCLVPFLTLHCSGSGESAFTPTSGFKKDAGKTDAKADAQDAQATDQVVPEASGQESAVGQDVVSEPVGPQKCTVGLIECKNNQKRECQADGTWGAEEDCGTKICDILFGCVVCKPGTGTCIDANTAHRCANDGSGYYDETCDPDLGSNCDETEGVCTGACAPSTLGKSYIGCEYYPTVTANTQLPNLSAHFAVAVSNTTKSEASVKVLQGASVVAQVTVAPDSAQVIHLPWNELRSSAQTQMFPGAAYHLKSTQPVTVYQFNPLEYAAGGSNTYTNDASLLLPVTTWGKDYIVASRNTWEWQGFIVHGFYAVVASKDNTTVTLTPSPTGQNIIPGAGVQANGTGTITLNAGDVLQVQTANSTAADATGTVVSADKPIEVFGGHDCTFVPADVGYCDHLEESMFPLSTLSTEYVVSAPSVPGQGQPGAAFTRVIAVEADTALTYDPPGGGWPGSIPQAGGYVEINNAGAFRVTATKKVLVVQYMQGNGDSTVPGDPAMALAVTTPQFRKDYLFHAPTNYDNNYVNVIAPEGATVTLDGAAVGSWNPIGGTGLNVARIPLPNNADGNHRITSDKGTGITVYGYGVDTSYWYPGGLNLIDL